MLYPRRFSMHNKPRRPNPAQLVPVIMDKPSQRTCALIGQLLPRGSTILDRDVVNSGWAARNGHLELLKAIFVRGGYPSRSAANDAAAGGYLEIVKYLSEERRVTCDGLGVDFAALGGHLHVIKYFYETTRIRASTLGLTLAARANHLEVVKYLLAHAVKPMSYVIRYAERNNIDLLTTSS